MKIGDKVVYIMQTLPQFGLIHGNIYTVLNVADCGHCKDGLCIDVGLTHDKAFVICDTCLNIIHIGEEYFLDHRGFRLATEDEYEINIETLINECFNNERNVQVSDTTKV